MSKLLEVDNLRISFHSYAGTVRAVRGVSFEVSEGETLAFVGESGCGKTVTAKSILRLLPARTTEISDDSVIRYQGRDVLAMDDRELQSIRGNEISMIFQDPMTSLNPTMKIGRQITESLTLHRGLRGEEAKAEAVRMLEMVRIPEAARRFDCYPHQLSGGMRQRVMIAMALSCDPALLIADEPTTALDVTIQAEIMQLMDDLKKELGTAIILVTHDLGVVAGSSDRVQIMYAGQILERGTTREIFADPRHPYTWALLRSIPGDESAGKGELYALTGTPPDLIQDISGCPFAPRCEYCMQACREETPPCTDISDTHSVSCWLMHPDAPDITWQDVKAGGAVR